MRLVQHLAMVFCILCLAASCGEEESIYTGDSGGHELGTDGGLLEARPPDLPAGGETSLPAEAGPDGPPADGAADAIKAADGISLTDFSAGDLDGAGGEGLVTEGGMLPDSGTGLTCSAVLPAAGNNSAAVTLTLSGSGFEVGATVSLLDLVTSATLQLGVATVSDSNGDGIYDTAKVTVTASTAQGVYLVSIKNPTLGTQAACGYYTSTTETAPTVTDVTPDTAWVGDFTDTVLSDQSISIKGTGFMATPSVRFTSVTTSKTYEAPIVGYVSATSLTSVCPSESQVMPAGSYYVDVINPSQLSARWTVAGTPGIFKVTTTPPPKIDSLLPYRVPVNAGGGVPAPLITVTGDYFNANATVVLLLSDGSTLDLAQAGITLTVTVNASGKDTITFYLDNTKLGLVVGIYPLRVVNPDKQYDTYYSLQIEHAVLGKLNADSWVLASTLTYPRERHAAVEGFDVFGSSYLYIVGGTSLPAGSLPAVLAIRPRPVLANTEMVQVDVFGTPSTASTVVVQLDATVNLATVNPKHGTLRAPNLLVSKRTGLTLVRAGAYLFAIGGATADTWDPASISPAQTALKTVEQARIMGFETRPNLSFPSVQSATYGLPTGSWFYRVSAVLSEGESLPSREVAALKSGGKITLKWLPVSGASSYFVYRSLASDGRSNTTRLIKANVTAATFTDDGQGELLPAPGRLAGSVLSGGSLAVGSWTYRVSASVSGYSETLAGYTVTLTTTSGSQSVKLAWDPLPKATYNLYRTSAVNDSSGKTYLLASGLTTNTYTDTGTGSVTTTAAPDGTKPMSAGSLTRWSVLSSQLGSAREGADAVMIQAVDGNISTTSDPYYIYVVGGRSSNAMNTTVLGTTERASVDPKTGVLGSWTLMQGTSGPVALNTPRAFFSLVSTQGRDEVPAPDPPSTPPCPDNDGDGYTDCSCGGTDCNDANAKVYPGAPEICGDGIDQDCDMGCAAGTDLSCSNCTTPDADGDGYNRIVCGGLDCNDNDATVCPDPVKCPEICGDNIDQDCDGKDLACNCTTPDADGDGYDSIVCGGRDCDDTNASICPDPIKCPEILCDGIDQDCDGIDPCTPSLPAPPPAPLLPLSGTGMVAFVDSGGATPICPAYFPGAMTLLASSTEEPVHLVAIFGDDSYTYPQNNEGQKTLEVAVVRIDGTLSAWTLQTALPPGGLVFYGNDGLLYHDFLFSFQGVMKEQLGIDSMNLWNNVLRYDVDKTEVLLWTEPVPSTFITNCASAAAPLGNSRAFLGVVRLNGYIFAIAGNGGAQYGPLYSIERIKQ